MNRPKVPSVSIRFLALLTLATLAGCVPPLVPVGPDGPFPDPPIDFARARELATAAAEVTENWVFTADDLRARYNTDTVDAAVFSTVFPGDDGESRFMLLTDHARERQTLVLGGTNTYRQWQIDALTARSYQADLDANVHTGWNTLGVGVLETALPHLRSDYELTVTGFSLGGAMTAIISEYLRQSGYPVTEVVTFGQPRVTDTDGIAAFADVPIIRFVNAGDPFPYMKESGSPAAHYGPMVVLYDGPNYAYVPAGDPLLEAGTAPFSAYRQNDFANHSEALYVERLAAKVTTAVQVEYTP
jgi:triacylglycerol lipase